MLDDHLLEFELILGAAVHQVEDGVQVFAHLSVGCLEGLEAVLVELGRVIPASSPRRHVQALRLEPEVELLEMVEELLRLLWHCMVPVRRVVVIDAQVNELVLHLVNDLPAVGLVLFLEILCISFYSIGGNKRAKSYQRDAPDYLALKERNRDGR